MTPQVSFIVNGRPAGQGSKRHVGHGRMIEMSKYVAPFRKAVHDQSPHRVTVDGADESLFYGPVNIELHFTIAAPKKSVHSYPSRPDIDKMCRAVLDGITGRVIKDDGQVVNLLATKAYGRDEGVAITVVAFDEP